MSTAINVEGIKEAYRRWLDVNERIARLEEELKEEKRLKAHLEETALPEAMGGLWSVGMDDGKLLSVQKKLASATPVAARREEAYDWVAARGDEGLIKNELTISIGVGETERLAATEKALAEAGIPHSRRRWIEPASMTAYVNRVLEAGAPLPQELFNTRHKIEVKLG